MSAQPNDENPFHELSKIFMEIQRQLFDQIQNGQFDGSESSVRRFGFSLHMGPDGVPHIAPLTHNHVPTPPSDEIEDPFTDVFYTDEDKRYHIIAELPSITRDDIQFTIRDNELMFEASNQERTFKKSMLLKYNLDQSTLEYDVRNGVLEAFISIKP
jgi:HSP20 family molecular chaperone IbpA